jgi:hypothetical protein
MSDIRDLETALRLTESMLDAARAEDWDRLVDLERERHGHISSAFSAPLCGADAPRFAEIAQQILTIDRELVRIGEHGRVSLGEALAQVRAGRRAERAYALGSG